MGNPSRAIPPGIWPRARTSWWLSTAEFSPGSLAMCFRQVAQRVLESSPATVSRRAWKALAFWKPRWDGERQTRLSDGKTKRFAHGLDAKLNYWTGALGSLRKTVRRLLWSRR